MSNDKLPPSATEGMDGVDSISKAGVDKVSAKVEDTKQDVLRICFMAPASFIKPGRPEYIGEGELSEEFDSMNGLTRWLEALIDDKHYGIIASIRLGDGCNPRDVRHMCARILDEKVYEIGDSIALEAVVRYGFNKWSRIKALQKLRENALNGDSVAMNIIAEIVNNPDHHHGAYMDADINNLAVENLKALKDRTQINSIENTEAETACKVLLDTESQFQSLEDAEAKLNFRRRNLDLMERSRILRFVFDSILNGEMSVINPQTDMIEWARRRMEMTAIRIECGSYGIRAQSFGSISTEDKIRLGKMLLSLDDSFVRNFIAGIYHFTGRDIMDINLKSHQIVSVLQLVGSNSDHVRYALMRVAKEKPADVATFVRGLDFSQVQSEEI